MYRRALIIGTSVLALAACSNADNQTEDTPEAAVNIPEETQGVEAETVLAAEEAGTLEWALTGSWRGDNSARDEYRNPEETLSFFQVDPSSTLVEIWPGGGWYTDILAPWFASNNGTYIAAHFPLENSSQTRLNSRSNFEARFSDQTLFGDFQMAEFGATGLSGVDAGSVDTILTFRNVHNWMGGGYAPIAFASFYDALRPGGVLGVVEHRLPDTREQDPRAGTGYVQQGYVIALAQEAGFELVDASEINANPADTADHPNGVWTLPPVREGWQEDGLDGSVYEAIGESDRMTLFFRKPEDVPVIADGETSSEGEN